MQSRELIVHWGKATLTTASIQLGSKFSPECFEHSYRDLMSKAYCYRGVSAPMYIFGSSIMATTKTYMYNGVTMPRPNTASWPGRRGHKALQAWHICRLAEACEKYVLKYLRTHAPDTAARLIKFRSVLTAEHPELRICNTIFTAMTLVGDLSDGHNHVHVDRIVNAYVVLYF